jgi:hypothetical protein
MARTQKPPENMVTKGPISSHFQRVFGDVWVFGGADAPTDGTSGDGAGWAGPGSTYIRTSNGRHYHNEGTKASPTWTIVPNS